MTAPERYPWARTSAPCEITVWSGLREPVGKQIRMISWDALFDRFSTAKPFGGKDAHPGWSPATFEGDRRGKAHVRHVGAVVLDVDGAMGLDEGEARLGGYFGLLHTSKSCDASLTRFRAIIPLSRTVTPDEYAIVWDHFAGLMDGRVDKATKDPSRFWYTPAIGESGIYRTVRLDGGHE
jgi:putative DNA primase/helicase